MAVAVLTYDRPDDLGALLESLQGQTGPITSVALVDAGSLHCDLAPYRDDLDITLVRSESNLGGAGGFSLAILTALATTADWVWIMDDDARPERPECLQEMLDGAEARGLDAVSPIIVAPEDPTRLSFPFRLDGAFTYDRAQVEDLKFVPQDAMLFNGLLIRREAIFKVGLPDLRMFIRGDEVDYLLRLKKSGVPFGTLTTAAFVHPTGWDEVRSLVDGRFHVLIPGTPFKRFYFFRNRGYLIRRHRRVVSLAIDLVGYPVHYLVKERDLVGFRSWFRAFWAGLRGDLSGTPPSADGR